MQTVGFSTPSADLEVPEMFRRVLAFIPLDNLYHCVPTSGQLTANVSSKLHLGHSALGDRSLHRVNDI